MQYHFEIYVYNLRLNLAGMSLFGMSQPANPYTYDLLIN